MGRMEAPKDNGASSYLKLKSGDNRRVRLLFDDANPAIVKVWWHLIDVDNAIGRMRHRWLCVGSAKGCPLCKEMSDAEAQNGKKANKDKAYPFQVKFVCNAWSYADKSVKLLEMGKKLQESIDKIEKALGQNIEMADLVISREGEKLGTVYHAVNMPPSADFVLPAKVVLIDVKAEFGKSIRTEEQLRDVLSGEYDRNRSGEPKDEDADPPPVPPPSTQPAIFNPAAVGPTGNSFLSKAQKYAEIAGLKWADIEAYYSLVVFKRPFGDLTRSDWERVGRALALATTDRSVAGTLTQAIKDMYEQEANQVPAAVDAEEVPF